jgi:general secretion pathway protein G
VRAATPFLLAILGIGLLYAILWPKFGGGDGARPVATRADINGDIKFALDRFEVDNGNYPKSLQDLVQPPADAKNWHGSYLDSTNLPIDPWGDDYIYEYPGKHNKNGYDLFSAGPDGKPGTKDDIGNW